MTPEISSLLVGLFGGAGATLVWETLLKPMRERRAIAEVLSAEVSINIQLLAAARHYANPNKVPPDFTLSTIVFESVIDRVGELPPQLVGEVVFLYSYFKELNDHPKLYIEFVKELRSQPANSPNHQQVERELLACVQVFNSYIEKAITRVNLVQPRLLRTAFPWWSPRRWKRRPSVQLNMDELAARIAKSEAERQALAAEIEHRAQQRRGGGQG